MNRFHKIILIVIIVGMYILSCGSKNNEEKKEIEKSITSIIRDEEKNEKEIMEKAIKEGENIKYEDDEAIKEIVFGNKSMELRSEIEKIINDDEKYGKYMKLLRDYETSVSTRDFDSSYEDTFLDDNKNFKIPSEKDIEIFFEFNSDDQYGGINRGISQVEKIIDKNPKYKDLDRIVKEFIDAVKEERENISEIKKYYTLKEYKNDNFNKGKILNDEYLAKVQKSKEKYTNFYKITKDFNYFITNENIKYLEKKKDRIAELQIEKLYFLFEMLSDKLIDNKIVIFYNKEFTIPVEDKKAYIEELKSMQKTLRKTLENSKKISEEQLKKENMNPILYKRTLERSYNMSNMSAVIINYLELEKYKEVSQIIGIFIAESGYLTYDLEELVSNN